MASTFNARIEELQQLVGEGNLRMSVNVHQPYAAAEHNIHYYKHPRGGMPDYLEAPFDAEHGDMLIILSEAVLDGSLREAAIDAVGKFEEWVETYAPVEFNVLRNSCNLYVEDNGVMYYERPQKAPYESWKE